MYAIIATGGKQYKAAKGDVLQIEKLEAEVGDEVEFDQVLMVSDDKNIQIGTPYVEGAKVVGEIKNQIRGDKIEIIKFRRRKHSMKKQGHRQYLTEVKIKAIKS